MHLSTLYLQSIWIWYHHSVLWVCVSCAATRCAEGREEGGEEIAHTFNKQAEIRACASVLFVCCVRECFVSLCIICTVGRERKEKTSKHSPTNKRSAEYKNIRTHTKRICECSRVHSRCFARNCIMIVCGSVDWVKFCFFFHLLRRYSAAVSTQDSDSWNPGSNPCSA